MPLLDLLCHCLCTLHPLDFSSSTKWDKLVLSFRVPRPPSPLTPVTFTCTVRQTQHPEPVPIPIHGSLGQAHPVPLPASCPAFLFPIIPTSSVLVASCLPHWVTLCHADFYFHVPVQVTTSSPSCYSCFEAGPPPPLSYFHDICHLRAPFSKVVFLWCRYYCPVAQRCVQGNTVLSQA